jgi:SAF domain
MTDLRTRPASDADTRPPGPSDSTDRSPAFRPASRRRNRIAFGVALAAAAIAGNVLVYSSLDDTDAVVQVVRDVPAGEQITADMLRPVDVDVDDSVAVVPADDIDTVIGRYAKVRLVAGSLVTSPALQPDPLVAAGSSIVAIQVGEGALPAGLRERSPIEVVLPDDADDPTAQPVTVDARVVGLPYTPDAAIGTQSLSIEVDEADAARVASADDVRVVLVSPRPDVAEDEG